jgi:cephalosporin hydroxylase
VDPSRSWGPGASPKTAVLQFMEENPGKFVNASEFESKSLLSVAPQGFWLRV